MKMCRSCCISTQYCLTSAKFFACSDVTGTYTVKWYKNWTTGTVPSGTLEATETVTSFPHCYTPSDKTQAYSAYITLPGFKDVIVRFTALGAGATQNAAVTMTPPTLAITHDHGSGTLSGSFANPYVNSASTDTFVGCFTATDNVSCSTATACPGTSGTYAFKFTVKRGNPTGGCITGTALTCQQDTANGNCSTGGTPTTAFQPSTCSGNTITSTCAGGAATYSINAQTVVTSCGSPFNVTLNFTRGGTCDLTPVDKVACNSITLTF